MLSAVAARYSFEMLPGQNLSDSAVWHVSTWSGECVIMRRAEPDKYCCPYALVHMPQGQPCPVGDVFNESAADAVPWNPYPAHAAPMRLRFAGARRAWYDLDCSNRTTAEQNTQQLNTMLAALQPGDTLSIDGNYCLLAGVQASRLSHVTVDINGELRFGQGPKEWPQATNGGYLDAITFYGATNLTLTSSTRTGSIRALSCSKWYPADFEHLHAHWLGGVWTRFKQGDSRLSRQCAGMCSAGSKTIVQATCSPFTPIRK
jgi:hypothetical protein